MGSLWLIVSVIPKSKSVDRRIRWFTVSKAADRSCRIRTDDLEFSHANQRGSAGCSLWSVCFWTQTGCQLGHSVREKQRDEHTSFKSFFKEKKGNWSVGFNSYKIECCWVFLSSGVTQACLNAVGKMPVRRDVWVMAKLFKRWFVEGVKGWGLESRW